MTNIIKTVMPYEYAIQEVETFEFNISTIRDGDIVQKNGVDYIVLDMGIKKTTPTTYRGLAPILRFDLVEIFETDNDRTYHGFKFELENDTRVKRFRRFEYEREYTHNNKWLCIYYRPCFETVVKIIRAKDSEDAYEEFESMVDWRSGDIQIYKLSEIEGFLDEY
jgi:hypothetical protein